MAVQTTHTDTEYIENEINNVQSNAIRITEDKLRVKLPKILSRARRSHDWLGSLGVSVSIFLAFTTANFHDTLGISGEHWSFLFGLFGIIAFIFFVVWGIVALTNRVSIDKIIEELKKP